MTSKCQLAAILLSELLPLAYNVTHHRTKEGVSVLFLLTGDVQIGIVVSGEGCVRCGENALPVKQGSEVFFPCQVRDAVFEGDFSIILCNPGVTAEYK